MIEILYNLQPVYATNSNNSLFLFTKPYRNVKNVEV